MVPGLTADGSIQNLQNELSKFGLVYSFFPFLKKSFVKEESKGLYDISCMWFYVWTGQQGLQESIVM